jgi:hypothetical protein
VVAVVLSELVSNPPPPWISTRETGHESKMCSVKLNWPVVPDPTVVLACMGNYHKATSAPRR